jgi:hypothetical protein
MDRHTDPPSSLCFYNSSCVAKIIDLCGFLQLVLFCLRYSPTFCELFLVSFVENSVDENSVVEHSVVENSVVENLAS